MSFRGRSKDHEFGSMGVRVYSACLASPCGFTFNCCNMRERSATASILTVLQINPDEVPAWRHDSTKAMTEGIPQVITITQGTSHSHYYTVKCDGQTRFNRFFVALRGLPYTLRILFKQD